MTVTYVRCLFRNFYDFGVQAECEMENIQSVTKCQPVESSFSIDLRCMNIFARNHPKMGDERVLIPSIGLWELPTH